MGISSRLVLLLVVSAVTVCAQQPDQNQQNGAKVVNVTAAPRSAVPYESVAKLKLASRKDTYRLGELVIIDAALLNRSKETLFFFNFRPRFSVSNSDGGQLGLVPYGIAELALDASSFTLTEPEDFIVNSSIILVGCDEEPFGQAEKGNKSNLEQFNENLFTSRGSACLQISKPGTYYISAEANNNHVLLSPEEANVKTAVGTIRSNRLKIEVVK